MPSILNMNKPKIKKLIESTSKIEGWLSPQEGVFLFRLANTLPFNAVVVEIGSWKGKSAIWLSSGLTDKQKARLYAIDPHIGSPEKTDEYEKIDTFQEFKNNIKRAGLEKYVSPIREKAGSAAPNFNKRIDLLFIDGSHTYTAAKEDFTKWSGKLKKDGWVVLHDATVLAGPWKVARDFIFFSSQFQNTGMLGSMIFGQFKPTKKIINRLINLANNFLSYLFAMSYVKLRKIPLPKSWRRHASRANFKRRVGIIKS